MKQKLKYVVKKTGYMLSLLPTFLEKQNAEIKKKCPNTKKVSQASLSLCIHVKVFE